jgi:hypothetical protein
MPKAREEPRGGGYRNLVVAWALFTGCVLLLLGPELPQAFGGREEEQGYLSVLSRGSTGGWPCSAISASQTLGDLTRTRLS